MYFSFWLRSGENNLKCKENSFERSRCSLQLLWQAWQLSFWYFMPCEARRSKGGTTKTDWFRQLYHAIYKYGRREKVWSKGIQNNIKHQQRSLILFKLSINTLTFFSLICVIMVFYLEEFLYHITICSRYILILMKQVNIFG